MQSRELEGRSCHVSLFAREPSSLQRSTTLSPCTLFSPYSGPTRSTPSSHLTTTLYVDDDHSSSPSLSTWFSRTLPPSRCSLPHLLNFALDLPLKSWWRPSQTRTTLTSWRTPWTCQPSSGNWTRDSTRSLGSMWTISGWCLTTPGCTTARRPASTSTVPSWLRCLSQRLILSCRVWDTAVGGRWAIKHVFLFFRDLRGLRIEMSLVCFFTMTWFTVVFLRE